MDSDSRKAQRNSFAHHRAAQLVADRGAFAGDVAAWLARPDSAAPSDRDHFFAWRLPTAPVGALPAATSLAA